MSDNPLSSKISLDTTDFKAAVAALNRDIRVIESGFRASAAALGDWSKSADGLQLRIKALTGQIDLQQKKVGALQIEYRRIAAEKGENSRAAQDLQIKLNRETETLNRMQFELKQSQTALDQMGKESQEAGRKVEELGRAQAETAEKTRGLSNVLGALGGAAKIGVAAIAALGAAVAGIGLGVTKLMVDTAKFSGELLDLSNVTGLSTTQLQELNFVGTMLGTDLDTMTGSLSRLTRSMGEASQGNNDAAKAFRALGVPIRDANGALRDSREVFFEAISALGGVENETERDVLAMQLFGKSAMELNPLIKAGADEMAALTEEAHKVGAVMGEENVRAFEAFDDKLSTLKLGLQGTVRNLAASFLPGFSGLADTLQGYLSRLVGIVQESDGDLGAAAAGIGGLIGEIIGDAAKQGPQMLQAGLGIIQGIIKAVITQLPVLIPAAVSMLTTLVNFIIQSVPLLLPAGINILLALVKSILSQLPMIINAALQLIIALATGIAEAIPQLLPAVVEIIPQIVLTLISNLPLLINAALQLILALATGIIQAIPVLLPYIPEIVIAIVNALITSLPMIADAAVELVLALIDGIGTMLPVLGDAAGDLINALVDGVNRLAGTILSIGRDIVTGIWEGIQERAGWFRSQIEKFFGGIVDGVKKVLKIRSPSLVFDEIGVNTALGFGKGFVDQFRNVEQDINRAIRGMISEASVVVSGPQYALGGAGRTESPINIVVQANVNNNMDLELLARTLVRKIERARG
jgi:hypothetical protein